MLDPSVVQGSSNVDAPTGAAVYVDLGVTGGAHPMTNFVNGTVAAATDAAGNEACQIAVTSQAQNQFATSCAFKADGDIGISTYSSLQIFYASNSSPGASSVAISFTLTNQATVIAAGIASSQTNAALVASGFTLQTVVVPADANNTLPIAIDEVQNLGPGTYKITENTGTTAAGQNPADMADELGIIVLSGTPNSASSSAHSLTLPASIANSSSLLAPSGISAEFNTVTNSTTLAWNNSSPAGTTFNVFRGNSSNPNADAEIASNLMINSFVDSNVQPGQTYSYFVQAVSGSQISPFSAAATAADTDKTITLTQSVNSDLLGTIVDTAQSIITDLGSVDSFVSNELSIPTPVFSLGTLSGSTTETLIETPGGSVVSGTASMTYSLSGAAGAQVPITLPIVGGVILTDELGVNITLSTSSTFTSAAGWQINNNATNVNLELSLQGGLAINALDLYQVGLTLQDSIANFHASGTGEITISPSLAVALGYSVTGPDVDESGTLYQTPTLSLSGITFNFANLVGFLEDALNAPGVSAPTAQTTTVNGVLAFSSAKQNPIVVSDVNPNGADTLTLLASSGEVTLGSLSGAAIISGGNNSASITLAGDLAQLNSALNTLSFSPTQGYSGPASLTVTIENSAGLSASANIGITVASSSYLNSWVTNVPKSPNISVGAYVEGSHSLLWLSTGDSLYTGVTYSPSNPNTIATLDLYASVDGKNWVQLGSLGPFDNPYSLNENVTWNAGGLSQALGISSANWGKSVTQIQFILVDPVNNVASQIFTISLHP